MNLKKLSVLLALLFFCWQLPCQSPVQPKLSKLEDYVIALENNSLEQQILLQSLEEQLQTANQSVESLKEQLQEALKQQETQSTLLKKSELECRNLKIALVFGIPATITITGMVFLAWNNWTN